MTVQQLWSAIPVLAQMVLIYVAIAFVAWIGVKLCNRLFPEDGQENRLKR